MALTREQQSRIQSFVESLPGKRGRDIPEPIYDQMYQVATGITMPLWGRPPTPHQMQTLFSNRMTTPDQIHAAFGGLPHPHAPNTTVAEYPSYAHAFQVHQEHSR